MTPTDPSPTDRMLAHEDETAERGGNVLIAAATLAAGGIFLAMVALTVWGWLA